jgi:glutathione synthase/RimK-type ligase-like ATP-grasp enzyme
MSILIVVNNPNDWPLRITGVQVVAAKNYLSDPEFSELRGAKVFNLCRSYRYQSLGYYVSLLAAARGHRPLPSINTIQDMKSQTITRFVSDELDDLIQKSLARLRSRQFSLSIYFGRNLAAQYDRLSLHLFNLFPVPLLRARFLRNNARWQFQAIAPIAANDIPAEHHDFVMQAAQRHFAGRSGRVRKRRAARYDLAILHNPGELSPPSDQRALKRFVRAAESVGFDVDLITRNDYGRLAEFDALFIRETTNVNHRTYRFASRAQAEGLVVVDDPDSILRCTNKVFLAELLARHRIPTPATRIVTRENLETLAGELDFPRILKQPDSAFSVGVSKADDAAEFLRKGSELLKNSEMIIAQEFLPTDFDWRVGIFDRKPLYVCRYYMASRHWQIVRRDSDGRVHEGEADTLAVEDAPPQVVRLALRAANLIGNGLYGVDLKQAGRRCYVIEVNDNPSIDAGVEDAVLKDELYRSIMQLMMQRVEERKRAGRPG